MFISGHQDYIYHAYLLSTCTFNTPYCACRTSTLVFNHIEQLSLSVLDDENWLYSLFYGINFLLQVVFFIFYFIFYLFCVGDGEVERAVSGLFRFSSHSVCPVWTFSHLSCRGGQHQSAKG
jgi:hypothetical protein